ncbi:DNA primase [Halovulum dunhuangense]|uniref:DNA primase n=1 Tax=Halovulum dunhuangense TaxID=1505036 RepID=A0A849L551_9RHOB|nr:DNA primase [Halovulum dunhuangense]NNU81505.1 DNA primase [Halovulum dunhuangense]
MSLPSGFLDEIRSRVSISQVVARKVGWDARKSNPGKGDYWAPCPFHQEKTASFHVDDRKGFYYCFGCHAKGDALSFVRETENVGFMEAVEILAREAGMQMPARDPEAAKRAEARKGLAEVMELAVRFCRMQLSSAAAAPARAYLDRRGMTAETRERFEIGFAPDSRVAMLSFLREKGVPDADIVAAGLAIRPDDGGQPFDRFRGRIMFPIRDARGQAIAFGGRAMDPNAPAKYLNSPETPLFDKGRALYNVGPAREASGKSGALVVAEGYMDVIALAQAGIGHAVAPLGTAVTEEQLRLMWRIADEPVIALDGDRAGLAAALRVIDLALPMLEAGKALRFCLMPQGLDPDDLIRDQGADAMRNLLDAAVPMVDLLWQRETEGRVFDSPERRAALDVRLRQAIAKIPDPGVQAHYREAIRELRAQLFRPVRPERAQAPFARGKGGWRGGKPALPVMPTPAAMQSLLGQAQHNDDGAARIRESAILLACLNHPGVAETVEGDLDTVSFICPDLDGLRRALLQALALHLDTEGYGSPDRTLAEIVRERTGEDPLERLSRIGQVRDNPHIAAGAPAESALAVVREELAKHRAVTGIRTELAEAEEEIGGVADEGLTWRLQQASAARDRSLRAALERGRDEGQDENALKARLQQMIDGQIWLRRKK